MAEGVVQGSMSVRAKTVPSGNPIRDTILRFHFPRRHSSETGVQIAIQRNSPMLSKTPARVESKQMMRLILVASLSVLLGGPTFGQSTPDQRNIGASSATEQVLHQFDFGTDGYNPQSHLVVDGSGNLYGATRVGGPTNRGFAFELTPKAGGGWTETVIHDFGGDNLSGPSDLAFDKAGNLYGTATSGGVFGDGAVFKLTPTSTAYRLSTIHSFQGGTAGIRPSSRVVFDAAGNLYGTTEAGGGSGCAGGQGCGTVFELTFESGLWIGKVLYRFQGGDLDGANPTAGLTLDGAGNLYGVTQSGGQGALCHSSSNGCGMAFKLTLQSGKWAESATYFFEDEFATGELALDASGNAYGTAMSDLNHQGDVFELSASTGGKWNHTILHDFLSGTSDGAYPIGGVTLDSSENLYGATAQVAGGNMGTVFELTSTANVWTEHLLYHFKGSADGENPQADVTFDSAGNLYGTTYQGGGINSCTLGCGTAYVLKLTTGGWTESLVHSFSNINRGVEPEAALLFDTAGHVFGTAPSGGNGGGVVFRLNNRDGVWNYEAAYTFKLYDAAHGSTDGQTPQGLVMDDSGNLYGTTNRGGNCPSNTTSGCGTVFKLTPVSSGWGERILYNFCPETNCVDGSSPVGGPILDSVGNLYGTTTIGGAHDGGTVFRVDPSGVETVLYSFPSKTTTDVAYPTGPLLFDSAGNLYGTALDGGTTSTSCPQGCGGVFELSATGGGAWTERVLYLFTGGNDGAEPTGNLALDSAGNLYGTTSIGGTAGFGVAFQLTPTTNGPYQLSTLHSFQGASDGINPTSGLTRDAAGNLYGVTGTGGTLAGGGAADGTVFELSPMTGSGWSESILHNFGAGTDGIIPFGPVILDGTGNIYGTTELGGVPDGGIVFELTR
jgi:uncharacterized repeat protein (TIGR03803 family)